MKSRFLWMLMLQLICFSAPAQDKSALTPLVPGYYIVVAAYLTSQEDYAEHFMTKVNQDGHHAQFGYDATRKFYYVYLDYYTDFNTSIQEMLKTRKAGGFPTAWVRIMKGQIVNEKINLLVEKKTIKPEAVEGKVAPKKEVETKAVVAVREPVPTIPLSQTTSLAQTVTAVQTPVVTSNPITLDVIENGKADPVYRPQILTNTPVFLSLFNPTNNAVVEGDVEVVDAERSKLISKVKGNDYLSLPDPKSKSGKLTLISSSFGYRSEQHELNYKSTESDTLQSYVSLVGNYYMVRFDMIRLHRGDIATLYNVYFYNDASVMLPESKYELSKLFQMMQENPKYRIRLHGHTNGRAAGTLITMGETKNFFELTSDVKRGVGTAKDLSRKRAEIIRDWLVANGVNTNRIEVKAWGGSRMVHDKNSVQARKNVRVEVEVLDE